MNERQPSITEKIGVAAFAKLLEATSWCFTKAQRDAIKIVRDENKCQDPNTTIAHGGRLEVDHILPQRFAHEALGMVDSEVDVPENAITRCQNHHVGHPDAHHPDNLTALAEYRSGNKQAFEEMFKVRDQKIVEKRMCWNNAHDVEARIIARERTKMADEKHGLAWWKWSRWFDVGGLELEKILKDREYKRKHTL